MIRPDHLVLAARDLGSGTAWLEARLGVALAGGGRHQAMGTHNRLLRLGEDFYLELIAIDPDAAAPGRPRWFGLDTASGAFLERPRLIHWVARCDDIDSAAGRCGWAAGEITGMSRGDYRWRITVPADGSLPGEGLLPSLIQWDVPFHPASCLPESGCRLMKLEAFHPAPDVIKRALAQSGLASHLDLHAAAPGEPMQLVAYVKTPGGLVELD